MSATGLGRTLDTIAQSSGAAGLRERLAERWPQLAAARLRELAIVGAADEGVRLAGLCAEHGIAEKLQPFVMSSRRPLPLIDVRLMRQRFREHTGILESIMGYGWNWIGWRSRCHRRNRARPLGA